MRLRNGPSSVFLAMLSLLCLLACVESTPSPSTPSGRADPACTLPRREPFSATWRDHGSAVVPGNRISFADLDNDGLDELVSLNRCPRIYARGPEGYTPSSTMTVIATECQDDGPIAGQLSDVNGDGYIDALVLSDRTVRVFLNNRGTALEQSVDQAGLWPERGKRRASPSVMVGVPLDHGFGILIGWRGNEQFFPRDELIMSDACHIPSLDAFTYAKDRTPIRGLRLSRDGRTMRPWEEVNRANLHADALGSSASDENTDGVIEILIANERGGPIFLEIAPDGRCLHDGAQPNSLRHMASGMGVSILRESTEARWLVADIGRIFVYQYSATDGMRLDTNHPLMNRIVPGELWACHAEDWFARGESDVLCASRGPDSEEEFTVDDLPSGPGWGGLAAYFTEVGAERRLFEPLLIRNNSSTWIGYARMIEPYGLSDEMIPIENPARPGHLSAVRRVVGSASEDERNELFSPIPPEGVSLGHGVVVRFIGEPSLGGQVRLTCEGVDRVQRIARRGATGTTTLVALGCGPAVRIERLDYTDRQRSIICPVNTMDRAYTINFQTASCY